MKNLKITVNGTAYDVQVEEVGGSTAPQAAAPVAAAPTPTPAPAAAPQAAPKAAAGAGEAVKAPMPGTIVSVNVTNGQSVKSGDVVVILEAMKMENEIVAPKDGTVTGVMVSKGESVDSGAALLTIG